MLWAQSGWAQYMREFLRGLKWLHLHLGAVQTPAGTSSSGSLIR